MNYELLCVFGITKLLCTSLSRTRVTLKKHGDVLELVPPPTKVNNLIFGRTWVDSPGEMVLSNLTTGDKVVLYFQPCGWFGYYTLSHLLFLLTMLLLSNVCFLQLHGLLFNWMKIMYCFRNLVLHFASRRERREAVFCVVWVISMCFFPFFDGIFMRCARFIRS